MAETRRIIVLKGTGLFVDTSAPVIERINANRKDGVEVTPVSAQYGSGAYYPALLEGIRASLVSGEVPAIYLEGHGTNDWRRGGRHIIAFADRSEEENTYNPAPAPNPSDLMDDLDTVEFLGKFLSDYRKVYQQVRGVNTEPPRLTIAINSCFSEGILRDLTPEIRRQADILVDDSRQQSTSQGNSGVILENMAKSRNAEDIFVHQLLGTRDDDILTIPALATTRGVIDGDALRQRVTRDNFEQSQRAALGALSHLPAALQAEVRSRLKGIDQHTFDQPAHEGVRSLIGYLAHYADRFTSYETYARQGALLHQYYAAEPNPKRDIEILRQMDSQHRAMILNIDSSDLGSTDILEHPDTLDSTGQTALINSAEKGDWRAMEILFAAGATVDKMTVFGTALSEAVRSNKTDAVNLLLDRGANVNVRETYGGGSPLSTATIQNNVAMAALLLKRGARPDDTKGSHNALLLATGAGNHEMVKLLRSHGEHPATTTRTAMASFR